MRASLFFSATLLIIVGGFFYLLIIRLSLGDLENLLNIRDYECFRINSVDVNTNDSTPLLLPIRVKTSSTQPAVAVRCSFYLNLSQGDLRNVGLYIPSLSETVSIEVNGQSLGTRQVQLMRNLFNSVLPVFIPRLDDALVLGQNTFHVTVSAPAGRMLVFEGIFAGDYTELKQHYASRWLLSAILPTIIVGSEISLAIVFSLIWIARPNQIEFAWLAIMFALAATRGTPIIPDFGLTSALRSVWDGLVVWESFAGLMFCIALTGKLSPKSSILFAVPAFTFTMAFTFSPIEKVYPCLVFMAMGLVIFYLASAVWVLILASMRDHSEACIVLPSMVILLASVLYDISAILGLRANDILLTRTIYGGFVVTIAVLMTLRFLRAMHELDNMAVTLNEKIVQVEKHLEVTYEELRLEKENEAVNRERMRLMRDLHDGIGGELSSILALADLEHANTTEVAQHARKALTDMRLIISSLEDYGGDLTFALATWRERSAPQFRALGLKLVWQVSDVPALSGMGPAHVLDILRIVQESVTNIMKHANASRVWIKTESFDEGICLSICDDGVGFSYSQTGNGFANMYTRAARVGATLEIEHTESRTCVTLKLPYNLKSVDI